MSRTFAETAASVLSEAVPLGRCWLWPRNHDRQGYGRVSVAGRVFFAHRLAYAAFHGLCEETLRAIPLIRHRCDISSCVRPTHLRPGTPAANSRDMRRRGRSLKGEAHRHAKLTEAAVLEMRRRSAAGETAKSLGDEFGVHIVTALDAIKGRTWKHLPLPGQETRND